ncbi:MAG: RNA-binding transcriptional accessory protein [Firmicutes bacterium]|nr:RNA-binding transcriptional accessory protein [Bacillota bacterium]
MDIKAKLAEEFKLKPEYSANIVDLIAEGSTIPFIARYRKEMHGECDDQVLREFADRLQYLQNLVKRKEEVRNSIEEQGKWTDELAAALETAMKMTEVEDIYRPYKQKKKTRASVAIERGLEPLADIIQAQELKEGEVLAICEPYINEEKGVPTAADALAGAKDIIAERISDDANVRKVLRAMLYEIGLIECKLEPKDEKNPKKQIYEMYAEFSEAVAKIPPHRILAINRGEADECLKVGIKADEETAHNKIKAIYKKDSIFNTVLDETIADSYKRLIFPSVENEVRGELTDNAAEQAIKMFEANLKPLLLQPPLKGKVILGLDPGYRTGCKLAVVDESGNVLDHGVIYVTMSEDRTREAGQKVLSLIKKHGISVIGIGNGTASKETEIFAAGLIKEHSLAVSYAIVNEAGASVYSASKVGAEEFPDLDVTIRGAISIARRLLDPLAELIKIDVKSIGVGQYQHDMPQKRLTEVLTGVVEDCVNSVGVDLNTASYSLLAYVSGLNTPIAKNIVEYRKSKPFKSRRELLKVAKLGPKAFEQCAGFLRIPDGEEVLDNTSVHPESYGAAQKLMDKFGYGAQDLKGGKLTDIKQKVKEFGAGKLAGEVGVGEPTLHDIVEEILKPGRDIRDSLPPPVLRADLMDMKDLKEGMELSGTVRNVIDFGAFVDIGVHHDGLVHISEISDRYIKHPGEVLKVGDAVKVRVIGVDPQKQRINLSMRTPGLEKPPKREQGQPRDNRNQPRGDNRNQPPRPFTPAPPKKEQTLEEMLQALQNKFKR